MAHTLDVYKRQLSLLSTARGDHHRWCRELLRSSSAGNIDLLAGTAGAFIPVSYTHLDVYKRQL